MTQTLVAPSPAAARTLTASDRCDRCGAQAYTRFERPDLNIEGRPAQIFFCAHHVKVRGTDGKTTHKDALGAQGFLLVDDETHRLNEGNRQQGEDHA